MMQTVQFGCKAALKRK